MMMHLPLSIMPPITASSSLYDQSGCTSMCSSSLLSGQPEIIIPFSCCRWLSSDDACCISATDTHSGISVADCLMSTCISMPLIGLSFPSVWLCLDSQSAIKISGPGLYMIWTLYWWIFNSMHCMCYDNVATSFLNIDASGLWSAIMSTSLPKQLWWNFSNPCKMPSALHLISLYLHSVPVRLLLANAIGQRIVLFGAMYVWQVVLSISCNSAAPRPIPDASVLR